MSDIVHKLIPKARARDRAEAMLDEFARDPGALRDVEQWAWYERFARLSERAWDQPPKEAAGPLHAMAELAWTRGEPDRAQQIALRACEALRQHVASDDAELLRLVGRRATWLALRGDLVAAEALLDDERDRLEAALGGRGDGCDLDRPRAFLSGRRAEVVMEQGAFDRARALAIEGLRRLGDPGPDVAAGYRGPAIEGSDGHEIADPRLTGLAVSLWEQLFAADLNLGETERARRDIDALLVRWGAGMGPAARLSARARLVTVSLFEGDVGRAAEELEGLEPEVRKLENLATQDRRQIRARVVLSVLRGVLAQRLEDHPRAIAAFEDALRLMSLRVSGGRAHGAGARPVDLRFAPLEHALLAVSLAHVGRHAQAIELAREVLSFMDEVPVRRELRALAWRCFGEILLCAGEVESAVAALEDAHTTLVELFGARDPRAGRAAELLASTPA